MLSLCLLLATRVRVSAGWDALGRVENRPWGILGTFLLVFPTLLSILSTVPSGMPPPTRWSSAGMEGGRQDPGWDWLCPPR